MMITILHLFLNLIGNKLVLCSSWGMQKKISRVSRACFSLLIDEIKQNHPHCQSILTLLFYQIEP